MSPYQRPCLLASPTKTTAWYDMTIWRTCIIGREANHAFGGVEEQHTRGRQYRRYLCKRASNAFGISRHTSVSSNSTVFSSFFPWTKRWTTPRKLLPPNLRWNQKLQTKSKLMNQMDGVESSGDTYVVGLDSAAAQLHQTLVNTQVMIFTNRVMLVNINKPFMKY